MPVSFSLLCGSSCSIQTCITPHTKTRELPMCRWIDLKPELHNESAHCCCRSMKRGSCSFLTGTRSRPEGVPQPDKQTKMISIFISGVVEEDSSQLQQNGASKRAARECGCVFAALKPPPLSLPPTPNSRRAVDIICYELVLILLAVL